MSQSADRAAEPFYFQKAIARAEHLKFDGEYYQIPYHGPDARCETRPIKSLFPPVRTEIPIYLGTVGPRSVRLTGQIADGWLPGLYSPEREAIALAPLDEGLARAGRDPSEVKIAYTVEVVRADAVDAARDVLRPLITAYIGLKGVSLVNSYFQLACAMGWEADAHRISELYVDGHHKEACAAVPDAMLDEFALLGPLERIVDRLAAAPLDAGGTGVQLGGGPALSKNFLAERVTGGHIESRWQRDQGCPTVGRPGSAAGTGGTPSRLWGRRGRAVHEPVLRTGQIQPRQALQHMGADGWVL